jgi:hypothetical protein
MSIGSEVRVMKKEFKRQIIGLLDEHRIMTMATNRSDGWPQATVVGYVNDGLIIYCFMTTRCRCRSRACRWPPEPP